MPPPHALCPHSLPGCSTASRPRTLGTEEPAGQGYPIERPPCSGCSGLRSPAAPSSGSTQVALVLPPVFLWVQSAAPGLPRRLPSGGERRRADSRCLCQKAFSPATGGPGLCACELGGSPACCLPGHLSMTPQPLQSGGDVSRDKFLEKKY